MISCFVQGAQVIYSIFLCSKQRRSAHNGLTFLDDISPRVVTGTSSRSDRLPSNRQSTTVNIDLIINLTA